MKDHARKNRPVRILILALTRMGDLYETYPMVAALRERYPASVISLIAYREFAPALGPLSLLASVYPVDGAGLLSLARSFGSPLEAYRSVRGWIDEINRFDADLLINLTPNRIGAVLGYLIRAREKRGLHMTPDGYRAHYGKFVPYLGMLVKNRLYNNLNLSDLFLKIAGVPPPSSIPLSIPRESRSIVSGKRERAGIRDGDTLVAFATGASQELKRWPTLRFAEAIRLLLESRSGMHAVLLGSGEEDRLRNARIREEIRSSRSDIFDRVHDWTGGTGPDELFALLEQANILVSNDTGTMHAAALLGLPVVCLSFANLFYPETGPWGAGNIVLYSRAPCAPCAPDSRCLNPVCREDLDPRLVASVTRKRLEFPRVPQEKDLRTLRISLESEIRGERAGIAFSERTVSGEIRYRPLGTDSGSREEFFRKVFERVWKEDLEGIREEPIGGWPSEGSVPDVLARSEQLRHLAEEGGGLVRKIADCLGSGSPSVPETLLSGVEEVDRRVEEMAWTCPPLGPLCLFFQLEKESVDVWNPRDLFTLVERTEKTYEDLERRAVIFSRIVREGECPRVSGTTGSGGEPPCMDRMSGLELGERVGR